MRLPGLRDSPSFSPSVLDMSSDTFLKNWVPVVLNAFRLPLLSCCRLSVESLLDGDVAIIDFLGDAFSTMGKTLFRRGEHPKSPANVFAGEVPFAGASNPLAFA